MTKAAALNKAWLLTGGNLGNRKENLARAYTLIEEQCGIITRASSLYETAAWGKEDQPSFLNQVLEIQTFLAPLQLLKKIVAIEKKLGRIRDERYGPRLIDIDILLFNDEIIDDPALKIPHPEMQNRRFVLVPLTEIAPAIVHPVFKKPIADLLEECPDELDVTPFRN